MGEPEDHRTRLQEAGNQPGETTADGKFTVSLVECLGSCGTAPMFQIGFDYHENLTTEKVDQILDSLTDELNALYFSALCFDTRSHVRVT